MPESGLRCYNEKRDFERTPEPAPKPGVGGGPLIFVVQKHAARRLHYDLRLELDGVLKSWALPHGPSLDPSSKRLAVMVEDHPLDYRSFEGVIPKGEYGGGEVIVWDTGVYSPEENGKDFFHDRARAEAAVREGLAKGKLSISLRGQKLNGSWALVKMQHGEKDWLLIKHKDGFARPGEEVLREEASVISGLDIDDLKAGRSSQSISHDPAALPGSRKAPFPEPFSPMLAVLADAPFSDLAWVFEPKLDGYRTIAFIRKGKAELFSRRKLNVTGRYPYIAEDLRQLTVSAVFDGEIVALDEAGRLCFQCLQDRGAGGGQPIMYYVFDILYLEGYDLTAVPLKQRRQVLQRVFHPSDHVRLVDQFEGDGRRVFEAAVGMGLEGVIAKRKDSRYEQGKRSRNWLKVKAVSSDEFVIGGFSRGEGNRSGSFGALLLGYYDDGNLVYAGHVGSGFDEAMLNDLRQKLEALKTDESPFAAPPPGREPTTWVKPELVAAVKFAEWTHEGYLRSPVFLGLREDKAPLEVTRAVALSSPVSVAPAPVRGDTRGLVEQIRNASDRVTLDIEGNPVNLTNLGKALWPPFEGRPALTKRDLLVYLARVSSFILPHLRDRPLSLTRFPNGISGERFFQKHIANLPGFVRTVSLFSETVGESGEYIVCNNLATLLWMGQLANIEIHTWFSRLAASPDLPDMEAGDKSVEFLANHPDFIIFDLDPYIYSGHEAKGAEPELNRVAFGRGCRAALWLKEVLDSLSLPSFVKTSGKTGLHIHVPVLRQFDYRAVRSAARTIGNFLLQRHPDEITAEWAVEKRTGKVFFDYNQNVRGKTLASAYSPRPSDLATVSTPLAWEELGTVYPTDFTILTVPDRLAAVGDLWRDILGVKADLKKLLESD